MKAGFEPIEHTADIGMRVWARNMEELFCYAAAGMSSFILPLEEIKPLKSKSFVIKGNNFEEMLIDWLNELVYVFSTEKFIFCKYNVTIDEKNMVLKAKCTGEKINLSEHELLTDIKAATFSDLKIQKSNGRFETTIIFDV